MNRRNAMATTVRNFLAMCVLLLCAVRSRLPGRQGQHQRLGLRPSRGSHSEPRCPAEPAPE